MPINTRWKPEFLDVDMYRRLVPAAARVSFTGSTHLSEANGKAGWRRLTSARSRGGPNRWRERPE